MGLLYSEIKKTHEYVLYTENDHVDKKYPKVLKKLSTTYQQLWIMKWALKFVNSKILFIVPRNYKDDKGFYELLTIAAIVENYLIHSFSYV
ncbi:hypothetical protein SLU01_33620 [Sporosarcina luteola]|uniref:Uncharacterized protein n=1 Tax=Sporosarcina luteola TaxID=582850 RepID=A0A511ZC80_9BACL|nr:hypothetical protein SLU01_33620 [Sporosarcina luteola]